MDCPCTAFLVLIPSIFLHADDAFATSHNSSIAKLRNKSVVLDCWGSEVRLLGLKPQLCHHHSGNLRGVT